MLLGSAGTVVKRQQSECMTTQRAHSVAGGAVCSEEGRSTWPHLPRPRFLLLSEFQQSSGCGGICLIGSIARILLLSRTCHSSHHLAIA